jgi:hypothetical protein
METVCYSESLNNTQYAIWCNNQQPSRKPENEIRFWFCIPTNNEQVETDEWSSLVNDDRPVNYWCRSQVGEQMLTVEERFKFVQMDENGWCANLRLAPNRSAQLFVHPEAFSYERHNHRALTRAVIQI